MKNIQFYSKKFCGFSDKHLILERGIKRKCQILNIQICLGKHKVQGGEIPTFNIMKVLFKIHKRYEYQSYSKIQIVSTQKDKCQSLTISGREQKMLNVVYGWPPWMQNNNFKKIFFINFITTTAPRLLSRRDNHN